MSKPTKTFDLPQENNDWVNRSVECNANMIKFCTSEMNFVHIFSVVLTLDTSLMTAPSPLGSASA